MNTNGNSADGTNTSAVNPVAPTESPPTPVVEAVPAPHIEPPPQVLVVSMPAAAALPLVLPAAEPAVQQVLTAPEPVISHVAPAPVVSKIATPEPAPAARTAPIVEPGIAVAGLEPTRPLSPSTGLWRKMRAGPPTNVRAIRAEPKLQIPPVKPPAQEKSAARPAPSRSGRFALLAASIALVAGVGAAAGAAGFAGVTKLMAPTAKTATQAATPAPLQRAELVEETRSLKEALAQVRGGVRSLAESTAAVRANIDNSGKTTSAQVNKLGEQLARLQESVERLERSQSEPAARLAKVTETLERLERRAAAMANAPEPERRAAAPGSTGSTTQAAPAPAPTAAETTASVPAGSNTTTPRGAEPGLLRPPALEGWTVRRVYGGVAYIEGPDRFVEVEPGDNIRGVGRVEDIRRQGNRWVVVTNRGLIFSR